MMSRADIIKLTVKATIPPRDSGLKILMQEYKVYKKVVIPRIIEAVKREIKKPYMNVRAQQKYQIPKKLREYLKNLPYHPLPVHNQSYWIEYNGNGSFMLHLKTKHGEAVCSLIVPKKIQRPDEKGKRVGEALPFYLPIC